MASPPARSDRTIGNGSASVTSDRSKPSASARVLNRRVRCRCPSRQRTRQRCLLWSKSGAFPDAPKRTRTSTRYPGPGPQPGNASVLCVQIAPNRPMRPAIWTHRTQWTEWMLSRMLSRTMSSSSLAAWPWSRELKKHEPMRAGSSRIRLRPVWPCVRSRVQSCREDQSSAAKRIETVLTTSPTIQPATS